MNNDTIKAAEKYADKLLLGPKASEHFIAGAEYMQSQKDEQIKELVEFIEEITCYLGPHTTDKANELIQKHKG